MILSRLTLSGDTVDRGFGFVPAQGRPVGRVSAYSEAGFALAVESLSLIDDAGGRFQMVSNELQTGMAAPDFEEPNGTSLTRAIPFYYVTVQAVRGATVLQQSFRIRPRYRKIEPAGDPTETGASCSDIASLRNAIKSTSPNRTVRVNPAWIGVGTVASNSQTPINRDNATLIGHRQWCGIKDYAVQISGGNTLVIRDWASRPGNDLPGQALDDRDGLRVSHAGLWCRNIQFVNCEFSWSVDELVSVIGAGVRHLRFSRCAFYEPLFNAGHSEGSHAYGPLVYADQADVVFDRCYISGCLQRAPMIGCRNRGVLVQNCVIPYRSGATSQVATCLYSPNSTPDIDAGGTMIARGNLYHNLNGLPECRARAIAVNRVGVGSYLYVPEGTDHDNHFYQAPPSLGFVADPVSRAMCQVYNGSAREVLCEAPPFETEMDDELMPTATEAQRAALFSDVMNKVGVRARETTDGPTIAGIAAMSRIGADHMGQYLSAGTSRHQDGGYNGTAKTYAYDMGLPA